ncbi:IclR family transcriptional regulator domain-containing protein [Arthrobacter sp. NQ4]|uniref:IclR family transcriptional regulator domain-containing protein n=1 Tax=Arthrobacter sp. NQ4 TaxID=3027930 RepID=UPI0035A9848F
MHHYRKGGYSYDMDENEPGIRCVAAPVRDAQDPSWGPSASRQPPYMPAHRMRGTPSLGAARCRRHFGGEGLQAGALDRLRKDPKHPACPGRGANWSRPAPNRFPSAANSESDQAVGWRPAKAWRASGPAARLRVLLSGCSFAGRRWRWN